MAEVGAAFTVSRQTIRVFATALCKAEKLEEYAYRLPVIAKAVNLGNITGSAD